MQSQISNLRVARLYRRTMNSPFNRPVLLGRKKAQCCHLSSNSGKKDEEGGLHLVQAGLPLLLFCCLGVWVVSSGIDGKNKERDAFQGRISKYVDM
jgi:hypothetical protein